MTDPISGITQAPVQPPPTQQPAQPQEAQQQQRETNLRADQRAQATENTEQPNSRPDHDGDAEDRVGTQVNIKA